jgi:3-oxoacyl-[acyl-carrier-protein] synthase II
MRTGMASDRDIVITGLGVVSPIGIGPQSFWAALCEGRSGIRTRPCFDDPTQPTPFGAEVADFDPKQYVRPRKSLKVMSRDIQLGFAASDLAFVDAGLRERPVAPERLGVLLGADIIPCDLDELGGAYRHCIVDGRFDFDRWGQAFTADLFPLWMLKYLPNMPACHVGIAQDARGPNNTITQGEVSTLLAIIEAADVVRRGQADVMIAGGVGSRVHPVFWARGPVARQSQRADDPAAASRPFDAGRDGVVLGEAAAAVILESRTHAESRGARIFGRLLGAGRAFEPRRNGGPLEGSAIHRSIDAAMASAGLKSSELGFVAAHGESSIEGDRIEAQAIRAALADVPVTAPKSYFGQAGAASGGLETVMSILAFKHGIVPPTLNFAHPDPQCPVNVVHGKPLPIEHRMAIVLSHSPQGQAAAITLGAAE